MTHLDPVHLGEPEACRRLSGRGDGDHGERSRNQRPQQKWEHARILSETLGCIIRHPRKEDVMAASRRASFAVLGWQTWAILVVVLALVILAGLWFVNW